MKPRHVVCSRDKEISALTAGLARIEGKLDNGINAKIAWLSKFQWWQLSIMVAIIGSILYAMFYFTGKTMEANDRLLSEVRTLVQQGVSTAADRPNGK
jgi:hypothetical protein